MESSERIKRFKYVILGDPIPLARCRVSRKYRHLRVFDPQKQLKLISQLNLKHQHGDNPLFNGPLHMDAYFYFHIPRTQKKTKPGYYHQFKPDTDNLLKMIMDIGYQVLFRDDCIVSEVFTYKQYSHFPRTEFYIYQLENHAKKEETRKT